MQEFSSMMLNTKDGRKGSWAPDPSRYNPVLEAFLERSITCSPDAKMILFRRPIQDEFTRNDLLQPRVEGEKAPLGPQGRLPSFLIGVRCSILRSPAMAGDLATHRRHRPPQPFGYF